jgi:predicted O-methyltransferase YrrM
MNSPEQIREIVGLTGGGSISPRRGHELFEFVATHQPANCLELGFAHGVSTCYIAAALEAVGRGQLTSVDVKASLERTPSAEELLDRAGLTHRVELVREQTSYNWFLHRTLRAQLNHGRIQPIYDFCFIDGAHTWVDDGFAFTLVDKLLKPGGWVLFDDLNWKPDDAGQGLDSEEDRLAEVREILDLLVMTHPAFDQLNIDGRWAWARKSTQTEPVVRTVIRKDVGASLVHVAKGLRVKFRLR